MGSLLAFTKTEYRQTWPWSIEVDQNAHNFNPTTAKRSVLHPYYKSSTKFFGTLVHLAGRT